MSPGILPFTVRKSIGPVVTNVWPALNAAIHRSNVSGPPVYA